MTVRRDVELDGYTCAESVESFGESVEMGAADEVDWCAATVCGFGGDVIRIEIVQERKITFGDDVADVVVGVDANWNRGGRPLIVLMNGKADGGRDCVVITVVVVVADVVVVVADVVVTCEAFVFSLAGFGAWVFELMKLSTVLRSMAFILVGGIESAVETAVVCGWTFVDRKPVGTFVAWFPVVPVGVCCR